MLFVAVLSLPSVVSPIGADTILKRFIKRKKKKKKFEKKNPEKKKVRTLSRGGQLPKQQASPQIKRLKRDQAKKGMQVMRPGRAQASYFIGGLRRMIKRRKRWKRDEVKKGYTGDEATKGTSLLF